jgi:hypothetical protein
VAGGGFISNGNPRFITCFRAVKVKATYVTQNKMFQVTGCRLPVTGYRVKSVIIFHFLVISGVFVSSQNFQKNWQNNCLAVCGKTALL